MALTDKINLFNTFGLCGVDVQHNLIKQNVAMLYPQCKEGMQGGTYSTVYSLLLEQPLSKSIDSARQVYSVNFKNYITRSGITDADIVCEYIDISRSVVVSTYASYPFGVPISSTEQVTGYINFINHTMDIITTGNWRNYTANIVVNVIVKDKIKDAMKSPYSVYVPPTYKKIIK